MGSWQTRANPTTMDTLSHMEVEDELPDLPREALETMEDVATPDHPAGLSPESSFAVPDVVMQPANVDAGQVVEAGISLDQHHLESSLFVEEAIPLPTIEVAIPEITPSRRAQYLEVYSEVIELIHDKVELPEMDALYHVDFTDGRNDLQRPSATITYSKLLKSEGGESALSRFVNGDSLELPGMAGQTRKRKSLADDDWNSEPSSPNSDVMELDDEGEEDEIGPSVRRSMSSTRTRSIRTRQTSTRTMSRLQSLDVNEDDNDELVELESMPLPSRRTLRRRPAHQTNLSYGVDDQDDDELQQGGRQSDDGLASFVISDLSPKPGRPNRRSIGRQRSRRLQNQRLQRKRPALTMSRQLSPDSDIEFEAPRRSMRSTRNMNSMTDDAFMDDDSFYVVDDKSRGAPKVVSVRETFQPLPADSSFASYHMPTCHTCGGSSKKGQIVYCQGCSLSFHRACLGVRSAREHLATKIGDEDFVLQCKFCIGTYRKKDSHAPNHAKCQGCNKRGQSCAPFSERKTARQEEKLREQNGGSDPITRVSPTLINNTDTVLLRCVTCHRGWHQEHLRPAKTGAVVETDLKGEALKDFAIDWQCDDCGSVKHKIHRLVAWRPSRPSPQSIAKPGFQDLDDDGKEYLVKWESQSYFHCTWMPGSWVFGVAATAMRSAFGKRAMMEDLLKRTTEEAIPDEFLMADVILKVKMHHSASRISTKQDALDNIDNISKVLVKYQGLGYDDVVWDSVPSKDLSEPYQAFVEAYHDYVEGKHFQSEPYHKIRDRIKAFKKADFVEVNAQPEGLKRGKLMGYQIEGLNWLLGNYHDGRSVVLADEMGLGKTVQVVSLVTSLIQDKPKCWPFLIVVPNSTCPNWRREFKQWAPDLRVVTYHGGKEPQELAYKYELFPDDSPHMKAHAVIMSYDSAQDPRTKTLFSNVHWTGLVVDEGQRLKNDQNLLYVALKAMKIPFRLLLTGTPLQNNKRELFNLLQFIDETQDAAKLDEEYAVLDKNNLPKLHEKIRPYFLRRTKAGVLKFLPPMAQIILPVTMTVIQEKLSKSIMAKNPQLIKAVFANSKMNRTERGSLNNILMQLRKCLCHPFMYSEAIEERHHDQAVLHRNLVEASAKLLLLEIMLPKLKERGHRVLIFSQFLMQLDIIEDFLTGLGYDFRRLDGQISSLEKQRRIDAFNAPDSPIFAFLLSTRAGGVGINLATADTVIIMDPDFNPHQDIQALSRAHRIGQKQKVLCFQLVTKDSVEEKIMQVGRKKMALDHALIESMDDNELAGDDLESILKHGAQALFDDDYQKHAIRYDSASVDKLLDRSQIEQTKQDDEGSAETQFSYARVWANDKAGFEEGLNVREEEAPEPISSSVWDKILAQREQEARREEEMNREVLGRGNRRRTAINYKTSAIDNNNLFEGVEPDSSDSSDDFAAANSADDSDEDAGTLTKGKRSRPPARPTPTPPKKIAKTSSVDSSRKQTPKFKANSQPRPVSSNKGPKAAVKLPKSPPPSAAPDPPSSRQSPYKGTRESPTVSQGTNVNHSLDIPPTTQTPPVATLVGTACTDKPASNTKQHSLPFTECPSNEFRALASASSWRSSRPSDVGSAAASCVGHGAALYDDDSFQRTAAVPLARAATGVEASRRREIATLHEAAALHQPPAWTRRIKRNRFIPGALTQKPCPLPSDPGRLLLRVSHLPPRGFHVAQHHREPPPTSSPGLSPGALGNFTMDKLVHVLRGFPPNALETLSPEQYDRAIKSHIGDVQKAVNAERSLVVAKPAEVLQNLDPAVHSVAFLTVIDAFLLDTDSSDASKRGAVLDDIVNFVAKFDPVQMRFLGRTFRKLIESIGNDKLYSPLIAVELIATAILRIDPTGSVFTSTHLFLLKLATDTGSTQPALQVIDKDIIFYPHTQKDSQKETRPIGDKDLEPSAFVSLSTGLTGPLKPSHVPEYNYLCAAVYTSVKDWTKARAALERVLGYPTRDKGATPVMIDCYKKWILVGLLSSGQTPTLPSYVATSTKTALNAQSAPYAHVASLFNTANATELKTEIETNQQTFQDDGNAVLVNEMVEAYQKWQIMNLRRVYLQIPISEIRTTTLSARTVRNLQNDTEVLDLIRGMIDSKMLQGQLEVGQDGETYLRFLDDQELITEDVFAREISEKHAIVAQLSKQYWSTNELLSGHKEYVKSVIRDQRRGEKERTEPSGGFDLFEDEDLMTGVVNHSQ
ncbi:hypothetical protein S40288_06081 [Stachybotrys chartarum IBT 40288]|nr:hypothetical protein S40288_06081 [Stachybotrys chartarum IBT 40288]